MPEIGQRVSHYRIVEKLGSGGMGVVYKNPLLDRWRWHPRWKELFRKMNLEP